MRWDETTLKAKPMLSDESRLATMKLTPEEGFVLSLIDGRTSVEEICTLSTLSRDKTLELISNLAAKGVVEIDDSEAPISKGYVRGSNKPEISGSESDSRECIEKQKIKVPPEIIEDIERMYQFVQKRNYYDILGVPRKASREAVKNAYRILSRKYHPDQFYLKVPDDIRRKLDTIFATISEAYSTLIHPQLRQEYDEQLARGIKKKKIAVDVHTSSSQSSPKEKGYRLVALGDEAFRNREYLSALNNYKLAVQLLGELPSVEEKLKRAQFVVDILRKLDRIEKDEMLLELDTVKEMVQNIRANMELLPQDAPLLKRIASTILRMTKAYQVATELLMKAIASNPRDIELYFMLASAREGMGDIEGAIDELEKVLKIDRRNAEARERIKGLRTRLKKGLV